MSIIQTVKVAVEKTEQNLLGYMIINLEDFDAKVHKLFGLSEEAAQLEADVAKAKKALEDKAAAEAAQVLAEAEAVKAKLAQDAQDAANAVILAKAKDAEDAIAAELAKAAGTPPAAQTPPADPVIPVVTQPWMATPPTA